MRLMDPWCHVVKKADAVDLPAQIHEIREVELSAGEQMPYISMKQDLVIQFADTTVIAKSVLTEIMKLRQITSGFCYTYGETESLGKSKLNELKELLDEIGPKPVIVWVNFKGLLISINRLFQLLLLNTTVA